MQRTAQQGAELGRQGGNNRNGNIIAVKPANIESATIPVEKLAVG